MIQFFIDRIKTSIYTKIFMGLMILAFGVWGIGDVISPTLDPTIAIKADSYEVRADELQRRFSSEVNRLRSGLGQDSTSPDLRAAVLNNTIEELKRTASANVAAGDFGVFVTRDMMRARLEADQAFHDETGKFNQMNFMQVLAQNGLSEQSFITIYQSDLLENVLLQPVAAGAGAPKALTDPLFAYRTESRIADTLLVAADPLPLPGAPSDADLKTTYDNNISSFTAPEYRKVKAVVLLGPDLVPPESIGDEAVRTHYDEGGGRYRVREKRRVSQLVFDTKDAAATARALAVAGDGLMAVAAKAGIPAPIDLGERAIDDAVMLGFGEAVKGPAGQISEPVETALGWHLIEVLNIVPERVTTFEQVRDQIRGELAKEKAYDALSEASVKLEDEVASGAPMDDVAKSLGARLVALDAVDRSGLDPSGVTMETIVEREKFLEAAFRTPVNTESELIEVDGGYFIVKTEGITAPAPKPIDLVRPEVVKMWERQTRLAEATKIAEKAAADIGSGSFAAAADADKRLSYAQLGPVTRFGESLQRDYIIDSKRVGPDLLERLFKAKVGDVVTAPVLNGHVIARLKEIVPAKAEGELATAPAQLSASVKNTVSQDLLLQFTRALSERYPVTVNKEVVDQLTASRY